MAALRDLPAVKSQCLFFEVESLTKIPAQLDQTPAVLPVGMKDILTGGKATWWLEQIGNLVKQNTGEDGVPPRAPGHASAPHQHGQGLAPPSGDINAPVEPPKTIPTNLIGFNPLEMGSQSDTYAFIDADTSGQSSTSALTQNYEFIGGRTSAAPQPGRALQGVQQRTNIETPTMQSRDAAALAQSQAAMEALQRERAQIGAPIQRI